MEITVEYLTKRLAETRKAASQLLRDYDATCGAAQIFEQLLNELQKGDDNGKKG